MAIQPYTLDESQPNSKVITWGALGASDEGEPLLTQNNSDKTIQLVGTFGDDVTMKGSNDGINYFTMHDFTGVLLVFAEAGGTLIAEHPKYIKPVAGAGITSVVVSINVQRF